LPYKDCPLGTGALFAKSMLTFLFVSFVQWVQSNMARMNKNIWELKSVILDKVPVFKFQASGVR